MKSKVISLANFRKTKKTNKVFNENKYVNKYKESLKKMTKEELLRIEELLEN